MQIKVAIVDDDEGIRSSLSALINRAKELKLTGEFANAENALAEIPKNLPDVVLMDINLPGMNGPECVRRLKPLLPDTQFMMLTVYEDAEKIFSALEAGATGYLLKRTTEAELLAAIADIRQGGSPMTSAIARKVVQSFQKRSAARGAGDAAQLSPREKEILDLLARGYLYKEIAEKLKISIPTVNAHIRNMYEKLHVHSRSQAVAKYLGT